MISIDAQAAIVDKLRGSNSRGSDLRAKAMRMISELPNYNWSGIYRLDGNELVLDEYVGEATDHTRIPVGRGVCGTAVAENANQVIDDVRELENYLSCSIYTRSEIVVLIKSGETILGQIDIDGHTVKAFDKSDAQFLEEVASLLAERWV